MGPTLSHSLGLRVGRPKDVKPSLEGVSVTTENYVLLPSQGWCWTRPCSVTVGESVFPPVLSRVLCPALHHLTPTDSPFRSGSDLGIGEETHLRGELSHCTGNGSPGVRGREPVRPTFHPVPVDVPESPEEVRVRTGPGYPQLGRVFLQDPNFATNFVSCGSQSTLQVTLEPVPFRPSRTTPLRDRDDPSRHPF